MVFSPLFLFLLLLMTDTFCVCLGLDTPNHSATLALGSPGVFHGVKTYILQSPVGQITGTHSISAGLDYPGSFLLYHFFFTIVFVLISLLL